MGPRNRQLANGHHNAADHAAELVAHLRALRADDGPPLQHAAELARLVRLEWQSWSRYAGALEENRVLRAALEHEQSESRRAHEAAAASAEAAARELTRERARVEAFRDTRRYRLAARLAAPLDRLRGPGRRG
jgi:hypothetical protein